MKMLIKQLDWSTGASEIGHNQWCAQGGRSWLECWKTCAKVPSWEPKGMSKCPLRRQNTLNCPLGWLKHDKLPSWEPKHLLKCPSFHPCPSKSLCMLLVTIKVHSEICTLITQNMSPPLCCIILQYNCRPHVTTSGPPRLYMPPPSGGWL